MDKTEKALAALALSGTQGEWLKVLSADDRKRLEALKVGDSPLAAAEQWLVDAYRPPRRGLKRNGKEGVGLADGRTVFVRLKEEFDMLMCGHPKYEKARKEVLGALKKSRSTLVAALAGILANTLFVAAAVLAPALVAMLIALSSVGHEAYCKSVSFDKNSPINR